MEAIKNFKVAIVGRPNVGKSTLFNRLIGKRIAIVDALPGITRDRISGKVIRGEDFFELIDTGGYFENPETSLEKALLEQQEIALEEADVILHVMYAQMGVHPMDKEILRKLKKLEKQVLYVVNKVDNEKLEWGSHSFRKMGIEEVFPISAQHDRGIGNLLDAIFERVPPAEPLGENGFKIAIVGKPNVGKSSFVNKILKSNRTIVDSKPGTTRDSIYVDFLYDNKKFVLIDTAGLTRRNKSHEAVDSYSVMRTKATLFEADLVILMTDAQRHIESQDLRIARMVSDSGKAVVIVVNKWDLLKNVRQEDYKKELFKKLPHLSFAPLLFISVLKGFKEEKIMETLIRIMESSQIKVSTSQLNSIFEKATQRTLPPFIGNKRLKIYYATQISSKPPTFNLFINSRECAANHYMHYLENQIRTVYPFEGQPIKFKLNEKRK